MSQRRPTQLCIFINAPELAEADTILPDRPAPDHLLSPTFRDSSGIRAVTIELWMPLREEGAQ